VNWNGNAFFSRIQSISVQLIRSKNMTKEKSQTPSIGEPKAPDEDVRMTEEELKAFADGIAREMLDNLNTYAGQHEDEQKPPTTEQRENNNRESRGTLKERADRLAQEMVDNLNKYAGQHERER